MGTLFQLDIATKTLIKKLDFDSIPNGCHPYGCLLQADDGKLYGMTNKRGNV